LENFIEIFDRREKERRERQKTEETEKREKEADSTKFLTKKPILKKLKFF